MFDIVRRVRASARGVSRHPAQTFWDWLSESRDPYAALISLKQDREFKYRIPVGYAGGGWRHTEPRTHLLCVGPSQVSGKTSGVMIPAVLMMGGPVVSVSSKPDVADNTGLARSRLGEVFHFDPTGGECPPGFTEVRWSPITEAIDWDAAGDIAEQMMFASDTESPTSTSGSSTAQHFRHRGADLLAPLLYWAALTRQGMPEVTRLINSQVIAGESGEEGLVPVYKELISLGATEAADILWGVMLTDGRERSGIFTTVTVALRGYRGRGIRTAENPNFDPAAFVEGQPDAPSDLYLEPSGERDQLLTSWGIYPRLRGRYPTVYITCPAEDQKRFRPVIIGFLAAVRQCRLRPSLAGKEGRAPQSPASDVRPRRTVHDRTSRLDRATE
jgi:Type IV secretory system Conjugative DNA transfer